MATQTQQIRIGEIVETETSFFVAESFALHQPPALGRLVCVETESLPLIYGIVCYGTTRRDGRGCCCQNEQACCNQAYRGSLSCVHLLLLRVAYRMNLREDGKRERECKDENGPRSRH